MRLAPGEESGKSCEKGGQGAGWLQRVWKLEWCRSRIPLRMQLDVNVDCGSEEVDIVDVNVGICSLCPPVSQIQKLPGEERTVRRQVSCSCKIRRSKGHLRLLYLCSAERPGCAGNQRRWISTSNEDTP